GGWFGKIHRGDREGTANVGSISGKDGQSAGNATNVVTDFVRVRGEARSHDRRFVRAITAAYRNAFRVAASQGVDDRRRSAGVRFPTGRDYYPFRLKPQSPVVRAALAAGKRAGWQPRLRVTNGGLDANWTTRHRIPTVTFGAGQNNVHTLEEFVNLEEFTASCRMALALATGTAQ